MTITMHQIIATMTGINILVKIKSLIMNRISKIIILNLLVLMILLMIHIHQKITCLVIVIMMIITNSKKESQIYF